MFCTDIRLENVRDIANNSHWMCTTENTFRSIKCGLKKARNQFDVMSHSAVLYQTAKCRVVGVAMCNAQLWFGSHRSSFWVIQFCLKIFHDLLSSITIEIKAIYSARLCVLKQYQLYVRFTCLTCINDISVVSTKGHNSFIVFILISFFYCSRVFIIFQTDSNSLKFLKH